MRSEYLRSPTQSLILDLGDDNLSSVFSEAQLDAIEAFGDPLLPSLSPEITSILDDVAKLATPLQAYEYGRSLKHNLVEEPLKTWLSSV
ncbi:hypothetical protein BDB00DRAFT_878338 [Zychaea mexicana]|uniref:uncharacterized protein n=1 Tax=Zychaea mexicana TaxID=64656 RepID=UPI0022FE8B30|nr:uncharacterized protein BDB00DRAFT_878338 [Zychaea mexicana]KAI9484920.1 hypothetical protein BDB00DRAFT_878338 [Zychaea mexicana]